MTLSGLELPLIPTLSRPYQDLSHPLSLPYLDLIGTWAFPYLDLIVTLSGLEPSLNILTLSWPHRHLIVKRNLPFPEPWFWRWHFSDFDRLISDILGTFSFLNARVFVDSQNSYFWRNLKCINYDFGLQEKWCGYLQWLFFIFLTGEVQFFMIINFSLFRLHFLSIATFSIFE